MAKYHVLGIGCDYDYYSLATAKWTNYDIDLILQIVSLKQKPFSRLRIIYAIVLPDAEGPNAEFSST